MEKGKITSGRKKTKPIRRSAAMGPKAPARKRVPKKNTTRKVVRKSILNAARLGTQRKVSKNLRLKRSEENPVITPHPDRPWESQQTFNSAAFLVDGKVHLLYRALGGGGISVIGYAVSEDGLSVDERSDVPVYVSLPNVNAGARSRKRSAPFLYSSGGGFGGCEDPRAVLIDGCVYMLLTVFNGWDSVRAVLTSIGLDELLAKKWDWKEPIRISPPGEIHKNWVIFPEKIHGKYAILHSISPEILIEYVESLDLFDGKRYIRSNFRKIMRKNVWDSWVRGAGPPPLKTLDGWLLLYHAMDQRDPDRYKLGAMILDVDDPTKVIARSTAPILEPDEWYENNGNKASVIYSCGAVIKDGKLFVYYGGADTVVCVATADLKKFLAALLQGRPARLTRRRTQNRK